MRGFIFDGNVKDNCKAIVLNRNQESSIEFHSKLYKGEEDFYAIQFMREKLQNLVMGKTQQLKNILIEKVDSIELQQLLKTVKQYNSPNVQITIREMKVSDLIFITKYVVFKFRQIENLFDFVYSIWD